MTNIFLQGAQTAPHVADVFQRLSGMLPGQAVITRLADADIIIAADGMTHDQSVPPWLLVWGDGRPFSDLQELSAAVCRHHAVLELSLITRDAYGDRLLRQAAVAAVPGAYRATLSAVCSAAVGLITQTVIDLENGVLTGATVKHAALQHDHRRMHPLILTLQRVFLPVRWLLRRLENILWHENWMIGWVDAPIAAALDWQACPAVHWIGSRDPQRYCADPFAWPRRDNVILCEVYDFATRLGSIRQLTLGGTNIQNETPMDFGRIGHLSFPYLFEMDGTVYCLPESCAARRLTLYRWDAEDGWRAVVTPLTDIAAADSVLFRHGGYFWIAYTDTEIDRFDNLNLCYAASLAGPWRLHANNPVRRDPRNARCGGTPFIHAGKLYRPAQDCVARYGAAVRIMEIVTCTPTHYDEREVAHIQPELGPNPHGFHTLAACGDRCLVDGKRMIFSPRHIFARIMQRLTGQRF